jgi:two-component sensor histidine kinase
MQSEAHENGEQSRYVSDTLIDSQGLWNLYRHRTQFSPLPLVITEGPHHIIRYANAAFCSLSGKKQAELQGLPFGKAVPEASDSQCLALLDRVFKTRNHEELTAQPHLRDSPRPRYWTYDVWSLLEEQGPISGLMIHISDESETKHERNMAADVSEALLLYGLQQMESADEYRGDRSRLSLALRETEHRAKNSLQAISAALGVLMAANPDSVPGIELAKLQMHIRTIGAMNALLSFLEVKGAGPAHVSVRATLQELLPMWQAIVGSGRFQWSCDDLELSVKSCTSLATIINELVCNSVKHGAHSISLTLIKAGDAATLEVSDDGPGFSPDFKVQDSQSFGLKFVETVVQTELKGTIVYGGAPHGGASIKITFPLSTN